MRDVEISELLARLGLDAGTAARARSALEEEGLTSPRKQRIALAKLARAIAVIEERFLRVCSSCRERADPADREVLLVAPSACTRCGGSSNERALAEMVEACETGGIRRLVVVGGSPALRQAFGAAADRVELRLIDGTARRTKAEAQGDLEWADLVVVCGSSELAHKVSQLYTRPGERERVIVASRRGVEAVAGEVTRHAARRARMHG